MTTILDKVKVALRITTDDFDDELTDLINSGKKDLGIAGVDVPVDDELVETALKTYCKLHFGDINGAEMTDRLKASYDEQKAQLSMATGYTDWNDE